MRRIYTFLLYVLMPFIVARLYWKSRKLPAYRERIAERFVFKSDALVPVDLWVHAVSLGEVVAATPLIQAALDASYRVLVTTMTPTGSAQVVRRFGQTVVHHYLPYDLPWPLRRFFNVVQPRLGIIMETELWPNVIHQAAKHRVPLLLMNARLSDASFQQYKKIAWFLKSLWPSFTEILAQSEEDALRFRALGASQVIAMGNLKYDVSVPKAVPDEILQLKSLWGSTRTVVIAASTHHDEEHQLLAALPRLKTGIPGVLLLIAPRHPERFQDVYDLSCAQGFKTGRRSLPEAIDGDKDVLVVDSLGELLSFYAISDYAFVGGSFVAIGGHNVLEPISMNVPVFSGPYMNNSKAICQDLLAKRAMVMVNTAEEWADAVIDNHHKPSRRQEQVQNAARVLEANRGVVMRCFTKVDAMLKRS